MEYNYVSPFKDSDQGNKWNPKLHYKVPTPGAIIENGVLKANVLYPGLIIRYTADGTEPNLDSKVYENNIEVSNEVFLKAFSENGNASYAVSVKP